MKAVVCLLFPGLLCLFENFQRLLLVEMLAVRLLRDGMLVFRFSFSSYTPVLFVLLSLHCPHSVLLLPVWFKLLQGSAYPLQ